MIRYILAMAICAIPAAVAAQEGRVVIDLNGSVEAPDGAILRGLDRINGVFLDLEVKPNETVVYERLEITLLECRYPDGQRNAEAFAHVKVKDMRENLASFVGWMFASSPALSALDHPRYDVWVIKCKT